MNWTSAETKQMYCLNLNDTWYQGKYKNKKSRTREQEVEIKVADLKQNNTEIKADCGIKTVACESEILTMKTSYYRNNFT